jgi:hypothetical protein
MLLRRPFVFCLVSLCALVISAQTAFAQATQLNINGTGALPNGLVTLTVGSSQRLTARVDMTGGFVFTNLNYNSAAALLLSFAIPVGNKGRLAHMNELAYLVNPDTGAIEFRGKVTRAANVVMNVDGAQSKAAISNAAGFFEMDIDVARGLSGGQNGFVTSVINTIDVCCPRSLVPLGALTLKVTAAPLVQKSSHEFYGTIESQPSSWAVSVPAEKTAQWWDGLRDVATEVSANIIAQTASLGTFIDAQAQLDTMRALQELQAQAIKDYTPSEALCRFGSMTQNLANSDMRARATKIALSEMMQDRNLGRAGTSFAPNEAGADGQAARVKLFQTTFCRTVDSNNALAKFCDPIKQSTQTKDQRINRDVDYVRTFESPLTLDINFMDSAASRREGDLIALGLNLFGTDALDRVEAAKIAKSSPNLIQDLRSLYATRSVARNSFAALAGDKAQGPAGSGDFVQGVLENMGMSRDNAAKFLGENPSYFAQMEVLTKRMYQDPLFYADLMDKPANVTRQRVAIKALSLMQQRDLLESLQRREMILSQMLELEIRKRAELINSRIGQIK